MIEISFDLIFNFFIFLFIPFLFGFLAKKVNLSPLIGYIVGGLIYGNLIADFPNQESVKNFAYFGILFLVFALGLESNFSRFFSFKKIIIIGAIFQIFFSSFFIFLISVLFKFSFLASFLIGIALSCSSTALVAKIIQDRGEESSFLGEIVMGMLFFQDIAFIPFMIIFSSISNGDKISFFDFVYKLFISLFKSAFVIFLLFYLNKKIIPYLFNQVAKSSREIFNLFIFVFIFFITGLCLILDLPAIIGVFIAGLFLSSTLEHHHIFSQIRPIRDVLAIIFFVYIGTNIKLQNEIDLIPQIILFTIFVSIAKALVIFLIFLFLKFHTRLSFSIALYLFQIDEGAFILISTAFENNAFSNKEYLFIITSVLITLLLTPILIKEKDNLYNNLRIFIKRHLPLIDSLIKRKLDGDKSPIDQINIKNHVVICGYGRVGSYIGKSLIMADIPYIAIDYNLYLVEKAKREGVNIIYGDPTDIDILDYAEVDNALILVLALPDLISQERIILNAKRINKNIFIISRVHKNSDKTRIKDLGADVIIQPEFEASISIIKKIYIYHKMNRKDIFEKLKKIRFENEVI